MASIKIKNINREEFDKALCDLPEEERDKLWKILNVHKRKRFVMDEYGSECSMCGKPMNYSKTGRCSNCEQIWNS